MFQLFQYRVNIAQIIKTFTWNIAQIIKTFTSQESYMYGTAQLQGNIRTHLEHV